MTHPITALIVSYAFPPRGGVAVQRVLSWVQHFPAHGIRPIVLTVTPPRGTVQSDAKLLERIPEGTRIIRTPALEPYRLYRALGGARAQDDPRQRQTQVAASGASGGIGDRLYRWVQSRWLVPDPKIGWFPFALDAVHGLLAEGTRPDIIVATQPPASAIVIGRAIARLCDRPLVLDYRDPWTTGYYPLDRPPAIAARERRLELESLSEAALVTTVSGGFAGKVQNLVKENCQKLNRLEVVENGWVKDFGGKSNSILGRQPASKTILHTGSLYAQRSPEPFLNAIRAIRDRDPQLLEGWLIRWQGNVDPQYLRLAGQLGVPFVYDGFVDHATSLAAQAAADILLIVSEGMLTAKVYEYLQARRPVIGISPDPELDAFLRAWNLGQAYSPVDLAGLTTALQKMIEMRNAASAPVSIELPRDPMTLERGVLAARMATLVHDVVAADSRK